MSTPIEGASGVRSDADLIRRKLEAMGLSQREAARHLGVDDRSMRYYCAGKLVVPPAVFLALEEIDRIRLNDQALAMLEDGTMSASDGDLSVVRLRDANRALRAAVDIRMQHLRTPPDPPVLPLPEAIEDAYVAADESGEPINEIALSGKLAQIAKDLAVHLEPSQRHGIYAVVGGLEFANRRSYGKPVWDMYWQPQGSATDTRGVVYHFPDVKLASDDTIREWSRRGRVSEHPALRARYADLAWEVAKYRIVLVRADAQAPRPIRPNADDARRAIDAYLEVVRCSLSEDVFEAWRHLGRAVELAATLRDREKLQQVKSAILEYRAACKQQDPAWPFWLSDEILFEQRDVLGLTATERDEAIAVLERSLALRADPGDPKLFDPYVTQDAATRLGRWRRLSGEDGDARRAATAAGQAFEAAAAQATGLTAITLLERQAGKYRNDGDREGAARVEEEIRRRAPEALSELEHIEIPVGMSREDLEKWADGMAGVTFEEGLRYIAAGNLISKTQAETDAIKAAKEGVLQAHIPIAVMRHDGFTAAQIGSVDDDLDGRAVHHGARMFGWIAPFLNVFLARLVSKHNVDLDLLMSAFDEAKLFPAPRLPLVREGLKAWFAEDWIKTVHVLLPQIEAALRENLVVAGVPVMKPDPQNGGFQAMGLGEVLCHEAFRELVAPDIQFHLRVLLQDPRGINLRNEAMHGLAAYELFGRGAANWVVHTVLLLRMFTPVRWQRRSLIDRLLGR